MKKLATLFAITTIAGSCLATTNLTAKLAESVIKVEMTPYSTSIKPVVFSPASMDFDFANVLNIGSQSSGAGAGKVTFNPIVFKKSYDSNSPVLFNMLCSGTPFKSVRLVAGKMVVTLKLAAVKTMGYSVDATGNIVETLSLEYGGVNLSDGIVTKGWDRVKNVIWDDPKAL